MHLCFSSFHPYWQNVADDWGGTCHSPSDRAAVADKKYGLPQRYDKNAEAYPSNTLFLPQDPAAQHRLPKLWLAAMMLSGSICNHEHFGACKGYHHPVLVGRYSSTIRVVRGEVRWGGWGRWVDVCVCVCVCVGGGGGGGTGGTGLSPAKMGGVQFEDEEEIISFLIHLQTVC